MSGARLQPRKKREGFSAPMMCHALDTALMNISKKRKDTILTVIDFDAV